MRGADYEQSAMFSYVSPEKREPADHPIRVIRGMADEALAGLSRRFSRMYAWGGRPSIPPEKLLRALLLQIFYSVRERLLMEELNYNLLFRWFVGLNLDEPVWDATTFSKNRERLLNGDVAEAFFDQVLKQAAAQDLLSSEHFTVDGTLLEAWAARRVFRRRTSEAAPGRAIPPIPASTFAGRSGATIPTSLRPIRRLGWRARRRGGKPNSATTGTC